MSFYSYENGLVSESSQSIQTISQEALTSTESHQQYYIRIHKMIPVMTIILKIMEIMEIIEIIEIMDIWVKMRLNQEMFLM